MQYISQFLEEIYALRFFVKEIDIEGFVQMIERPYFSRGS
jgi:hypothetical protein